MISTRHPAAECRSPPTHRNALHQPAQRATNGLFLDWSVPSIGLKELWTLKWYDEFDTAGRWTKAGGVKPENWPQVDAEASRTTDMGEKRQEFQDSTLISLASFLLHALLR